MQSRFVRSCLAVAMTGLMALSLGACTGSSAKAPALVTPSPTPEVTEEPTQAPTDTPAATATPEMAPTPTPTEVPTPGPGSVCVGTAENQDFFTSAAGALKVDVYCAGSLPARWYISSGAYSKGILTIDYKKGGVIVEVREGNLYPGSVVIPPEGTFIENAAFGDRTGFLGLDDDGYFLLVNIGSSLTYKMTAPESVGLATFESIAAGMVLVSEP
jgi:hypothetical protein